MRHAVFLCSGSSCSKAFPLACRNHGAMKETSLPKSRSTTFTGQLSVYRQLTEHRWVHTLLPRTQGYLLLLFLIDLFQFRFQPMPQPPRWVPLHMSNGSRLLSPTLCEPREKNDTELKWHDRGSIGHQCQSMKYILCLKAWAAQHLSCYAWWWSLQGGWQRSWD